MDKTGAMSAELVTQLYDAAGLGDPPRRQLLPATARVAQNPHASPMTGDRLKPWNVR